MAEFDPFARKYSAMGKEGKKDITGGEAEMAGARAKIHEITKGTPDLKQTGLGQFEVAQKIKDAKGKVEATFLRNPTKPNDSNNNEKAA